MGEVEGADLDPGEDGLDDLIVGFSCSLTAFSVQAGQMQGTISSSELGEFRQET